MQTIVVAGKSGDIILLCILKRLKSPNVTHFYEILLMFDPN